MSDEAVEQGDEADEAGASDGASQLIPSVRRTLVAWRAHGRMERQMQKVAVVLGYLCVACAGLAAAEESLQVLPVFLARQVAPAFAVSCGNETQSRVALLTSQAIRLDGVHHKTGVAGSFVGELNIAPGETAWLVVVLGQPKTSPAFGAALSTYTQQFWPIVVTSGRHRVAFQCGGRWTPELTFFWNDE